MKDKIKELIDLLDKIENDNFTTNYKAEIYGKKYSKTEWEKYKDTLNKVLKTFNKQQKSSAKYLMKNKEYNRKMRLLSYYRNKKNKTTKDYVKMENLKRDLDKYIKEKEENKEKQQQRELKRVQEALINLSNYDE